jgi:hypothetical protein
MVDDIIHLPGITTDAIIGGISFKDDSTIRRFKQRGYEHIWRISLDNDLGISTLGAGVETIQARLTPETANDITQDHGLADILIIRHIIEHAHSPHQFVKALKQLIKPTGYLVFEVPDCTSAIENHDYTTLWEEHTLYFTPETFKNGLFACGLAVTHFTCFPYPFENSLVAVVQPHSDQKQTSPETELLEQQKRQAMDFALSFPVHKERVRNYLAEYRRNHGKIILFGAGHLACTFLSVFELQHLIEFVVDDHPRKQGLFMPGSRLPIHGSTAMLEENIKLCLLSLNPISEDKVIKKNQKFMEMGGQFFSIFPASERALKI